MDLQTFFTYIYHKNAWADRESRSGPGSAITQTQRIVKELPHLLDRLNVASVLDIPCGDFVWMRRIALDQVEYTGADIVPDIIMANRQFENDKICFRHLDITSDKLPKVDLVVSRDCLVHFSLELIFMALENIVRSHSRYLLMTTFSAKRPNINILTGQWRPLNFELPPFNFPPPLELVNERCSEANGAYVDKCLGLWEISVISSILL